MAHSLVRSGGAALQAAALLAPALESRHIAADTLQRSTAWGPSLEKSQGQQLCGSQLVQRCSACARAGQGGQDAGRGRRGRGKAAPKGRRGRNVRGPGDSATCRSEGPRDSQPSPQPGTGAEESESPDRGVVVLTAERQDSEESENEASDGRENRHPAPESSASPEGSSEFESGSGSESESEASLREDIERLEREATQRLLALQKQQKARAQGELKRGEEAESSVEQEQKDALKEAPKEADTSEVKDDEGPDEGSEPSAGIVEDDRSKETNPVESSPPEGEPPAAASSSEVPEVPPREEQREAQLRTLAEAHALDRMFFYPEKVTAGGEVEVFLNRGVSTLAGKSEIELLGSFNDWQYQQLGVPLRPSAKLGEPWWSCTLGVPGEAYKLDFVFHSGEVYENNAGQDFFIAVEGGLDAASFAAWVGQQQREEQRRRLREKEAAQRAELEKRRQEEAAAQEAQDREMAAAAAAAARSALSASLACAAPRVASVYFLEPEPIQAGRPVRLMYNRSYRPLCFAGEVWVHAGYNSWKEGVSTVKQLKPDTKVEEQGDWYSVELDVPADALVLNWVLADAPPERAQFYDNNELRDFHAPVGGPNKVEAYLDQLEEETYTRIRAERNQQEEDRAARAARRAVLRQETAARTMAQFLAAQSHVLYTEPQPLQAGQEAAVYYNPQATVLAGRQEVWMRGGFNRWSHRGGTWGPTKMEPTKDGSHLKATVALPADAYILDAVFSERGDGDGGLYDNKGGLDYHIPIRGSTVQAPPLHIVHIALEMAPIAKVGGLGDVVTSLARAVEEAGHCGEVILPKYNNLDYSQVHFLEETESFEFGATTIRTWQGKVEGLLVRFIEPENGMFWVGTIYGRRDDGPRFEFFCHAALEYLRQTGQNPDILHCHDWSSAPVAWMYWDLYHNNGMPNPRVVFTIHNLEFGVAQIGRAMGAANKATTVSPTYAWEVSGHGAISPHVNKFHGIRNGIDADIWDPLGDDFLPLPYSSAEVVAGKAAAKAELQRRLGLVEDPSKPVVGFITRLTAQKGIHLIKHAIWRSLDRGAQVVLLGSAPDPRVHNEFQGLAGQLSARYGGMARLWLGYDEPLSHLIYGGSDIIVVPSLFEPCGLTQMVAMRYGVVPVVRRTGGLNDTVFDLDHDRERAQREGLQPNGYSFEGTDASAVDYAMNRALDHWYNDRESWNNLARTVMDQDWSWNRPALDYLELYYGARK